MALRFLPAGAALALCACVGHETTPGLLAVPLSGCAGTGYWTNVTVGGTQTFQMVLDSGSSTSAVAATGCATCGGLSPLYRPGPQAVDEGMSARSEYLDGSSWSGSIYQDSMLIEDVGTTVSVNLVAITSQSSFFPKQDCNGNPVTNLFQGILGLGPPSLDLGGTDSYLQQWAKSSSRPSVFSVKLCQNGGSLWMGAYDPSETLASPSYAPMLMSTYYAINLLDVAVGGKSLGTGDAAWGPMVVDIGSTIMSVPQALLDDLVDALGSNAAFQQISAGNPDWIQNGDCVQATQSQIDALPALTLTLPDATVDTFPLEQPAGSSYILAETVTGTLYACPGIAAGPALILGAHALEGRVTIFDPAAMQLGVAAATSCP